MPRTQNYGQALRTRPLIFFGKPLYCCCHPPTACCRLKGREGAIPSGLCFIWLSGPCARSSMLTGSTSIIAFSKSVRRCDGSTSKRWRRSCCVRLTLSLASATTPRIFPVEGIRQHRHGNSFISMRGAHFQRSQLLGLGQIACETSFGAPCPEPKHLDDAQADERIGSSDRDGGTETTRRSRKSSFLMAARA